MNPRKRKRLEAKLRRQASKATRADQRRSAATVDRLRRESDAGRTVAERQTPKVLNNFHTAATDWLGAEGANVNIHKVQKDMHAQASRWFTRTSAEVKADPGEFRTQADGMARKLAGAHAPHADEAQDAFVRHALFLNRAAGRTAAMSAEDMDEWYDGDVEAAREAERALREEAEDYQNARYEAENQSDYSPASPDSPDDDEDDLQAESAYRAIVASRPWSSPFMQRYQEVSPPSARKAVRKQASYTWQADGWDRYIAPIPEGFLRVTHVVGGWMWQILDPNERDLPLVEMSLGNTGDPFGPIDRYDTPEEAQKAAEDAYAGWSKTASRKQGAYSVGDRVLLIGDAEHGMYGTITETPDPSLAAPYDEFYTVDVTFTNESPVNHSGTDQVIEGRYPAFRFASREPSGGRHARKTAAESIYDFPEGTTAICVQCDRPILLDQREGGGTGKDWGASPEDWVGNGGIGMDYGCAESPLTDEEGTGGHSPRAGTISIARTASRKTAVEQCGVERGVQIGNQSAMDVTCHREKGHEGEHRGITLDSDDNAITYRWTASRKTASHHTAGYFTTAADVIAEYPPIPGVSAGGANGFYEGGYDSFLDVMYDSGWQRVESKSQVYFTVQAPGGDKITYIEGDLYASGTTASSRGRRTAAHATDIVGYMYKGDLYTPRGVIEAMIADGSASPAARSMNTEDALTQIAEANAIDRFDEYSFDTDEFPKVIFRSDAEDSEGWDENNNYVPLADVSSVDAIWPIASRKVAQWKAQFAGVVEGVWSGNALTFDTEAEATAYAQDLLLRWFGADMARVVPVDVPRGEPVDLSDPAIVVNYRTSSRKTGAVLSLDTHADGYGNWWAYVVTDGGEAEAEEAALAAIHDALTERGVDFDPEVVGVRLDEVDPHGVAFLYAETNAHEEAAKTSSRRTASRRRA